MNCDSALDKQYKIRGRLFSESNTFSTFSLEVLTLFLEGANPFMFILAAGKASGSANGF
jgi:fluoride ion exporter CrcB/FEX